MERCRVCGAKTKDDCPLLRKTINVMCPPTLEVAVLEPTPSQISEQTQIKATLVSGGFFSHCQFASSVSRLLDPSPEEI